MKPTMIDHILVLALAVLWPLYERFVGYPRLKRRLREGRSDARIRAYGEAMLVQWSFTIAVVTAWISQHRLPAALGFGLDAGPRLAVGVALAAAIAVLLAIQARAIGVRPAALEQVRRQLAAATPLLPRDRGELWGFRALSITAGVCEETLFRGMLIAYVSAFAGLVPAILISSAVFGIAHGYLSARDAVRAGIAGVVMALLYVLTRSLWVPMLVHAMVDMNSGRLGYLALRDDGGGAERSAA